MQRLILALVVVAIMSIAGRPGGGRVSAAPVSVSLAAIPHPIYFWASVANSISGPGQRPQPEVIRPSLIGMAADGSWWIEQLHWTGWGSRVAHAKGISSASNGIPNMAEGKRIKRPGQITLSSPGRFHGHDVYRCFTLRVSRTPGNEHLCLKVTGGSAWLMPTPPTTPTSAPPVSSPPVQAVRILAERNVSVRAATSATCSRAAALQAMARYKIGFTGGPVGQLLCGPFLGAGSQAMVASVAVPSCIGSIGWAVFRYLGGAWRLVMNVNHGAWLDAVGSDIREQRGVLAPADALCFPSSVKYHFWHWNGSRLQAGPWFRALSYNTIVSPDGNTYCTFYSSVLKGPEAGVDCESLSPVHRAHLLRDGTFTTCDASSNCLSGIDRVHAHVLPYGKADEWSDFHCLSESKGFTCTVIGGKAAGKGFLINASGVTKVG